MKSQYLILFLIILTTCETITENQDGFKVYDFDGNLPEKELSLADLMTDPELVILEKTEESLLPGFFRYLVGEKYILTNDQERILVFNRDGSFVKVLTQRGRGPGEFINNISWMLSIEERFLYMANLGDQKSLVKYTIEDGSYTKIDYPGPPFHMVMLDESWMMASGSSFTPFKTFELNLESGEVRNVITQGPPEMGAAGQVILLAKSEGDIYYSENDTLHLHEGISKRPIAAFKVNNPVGDRVTSSAATTFEIKLITSDFIVLSKENINIADNGLITTESIEAIYLDRDSRELYVVEALTFEGTKIRKELNSLLNLQKNNKLLSLQYDVATWLKIIENNNAFPESFKEQSRSLSEESNPVILIGKDK